MNISAFNPRKKKSLRSNLNETYVLVLDCVRSVVSFANYQFVTFLETFFSWISVRFKMIRYSQSYIILIRLWSSYHYHTLQERKIMSKELYIDIDVWKETDAKTIKFVNHWSLWSWPGSTDPTDQLVLVLQRISKYFFKKISMMERFGQKI